MAIQAPETTVHEPVSIDIPDEREYDSTANARVDRQLTQAIQAAEAVDNDYLVQLLTNELGSFYYDTR